MNITQNSYRKSSHVKRKIAIVGAGYVGTSCAFAILNQKLCDDMVLFDTDIARAEGEAADLAHGVAFSGTNMHIFAGSYSDCSDADIMIIAAGAAQVPGETRSDARILRRNSETVKSITRSAVSAGFSGIFIVATNPVDVMSSIVYMHSGFPAARIIGSGTTLDTARLRYLLGSYFEVDPRNVHAYVIGEHGDTEFVPWSSAYIGVKPIRSLCKEHPLRFSEKELSDIEQQVRTSAYKIIAAKQATSYGIGMALARIIRAVFGDEHSILTVSSLIEGEYGIGNIWLGSPCTVGGNGVIGKLKIALTDEELQKIKLSADKIKKDLSAAEPEKIF